MYIFGLWPTHKWTTAVAEKCYKRTRESIFTPLIRCTDGGSSSRRKTGITTTARLSHQSPHNAFVPYTHSNPAGAAQSQQHHRVAVSVLEFVSILSFCRGQGDRQIWWKQWMWPISAPLLTCSLSHVLALVKSSTAWLLCQSCTFFCLVEENRETCLTENIQQKKGEAAAFKWREEYNGPLPGWILRLMGKFWFMQHFFSW